MPRVWSAAGRSLGCSFALAVAACAGVSPLQANRTVDLVVAATTDIHGRVRGWDYYADAPDSLRGLSRVATIVDSLRPFAALLRQLGGSTLVVRPVGSYWRIGTPSSEQFDEIAHSS